MGQKALIIKFGAIGDVIMALPAVKTMHDKGMQIDWVCGNAVRSLLECYSWLNLLPVNDRTILNGTAGERVKGVGDLWRMVGRKPYEVCATLYYDDRYKVLTLPVMARRKFMLSRGSRENLVIPGLNHADAFASLLPGSEDSCHS